MENEAKQLSGYKRDSSYQDKGVYPSNSGKIQNPSKAKLARIESLQPYERKVQKDRPNILLAERSVQQTSDNVKLCALPCEFGNIKNTKEKNIENNIGECSQRVSQELDDSDAGLLSTLEEKKIASRQEQEDDLSLLDVQREPKEKSQESLKILIPPSLKTLKILISPSLKPLQLLNGKMDAIQENDANADLLEGIPYEELHPDTTIIGLFDKEFI